MMVRGERSSVLPVGQLVRLRGDRDAGSESGSEFRRSQEPTDAERLAERMNCDRGKLGFFKQESEDSNLSGASTTHSLEELSTPEFFSHQCTEIDAMAERAVDEASIKEAIRTVVAGVQFCVTIADPKSPDVPLLAVSEKFETITGYSRGEVLGKNCRFLNAGCLLDPVDLVCIRSAIQTGASFTAVLTNRRKSGEFFLNLLDLRGLTVARNLQTGDALWFLVGIQADVTNAAMSHGLEDHMEEMRELASIIRTKLADELSAMAVAGALRADFGVVEPGEELPDAWCLLPSATWRSEEHLPCLPNPVAFAKSGFYGQKRESSSSSSTPKDSATSRETLRSIGDESSSSSSSSSSSTLDENLRSAASAALATAVTNAAVTSSAAACGSTRRPHGDSWQLHATRHFYAVLLVAAGAALLTRQISHRPIRA